MSERMSESVIDEIEPGDSCRQKASETPYPLCRALGAGEILVLGSDVYEIIRILIGRPGECMVAELRSVTCKTPMDTGSDGIQERVILMVPYRIITQMLANRSARLYAPVCETVL